MPKDRKPKPLARLAELLDETINSGAMTGDQIAEKAGIDRSVVFKYRRGQMANCTLDTLERLTAAIGSSPAELFREEGPRLPAWFIAMLEKMLEWGRGK